MHDENSKHHKLTSFLRKGLFIVIILALIYPSAYAISSEKKIIYDLPLFDNFGPAFATWSGESEKPLGNALLKGTITLNQEQYNPGDTVKVNLDLIFSGTVISGKYGALMNELGSDTWMLKTNNFLEEDIELGQIEGSEYMGIGSGQEIPPLMLRNISHTYEFEIPDSAEGGNYDVYAFIEGSEYQTNPITITIMGGPSQNLNLGELPELTNNDESSQEEVLKGFTGLTTSKNFDEDTGESYGITDSFLPTGERVCSITHFDPLKNNSKMEWQWYDSSGNLYSSDSFEAEEGSDWAYGYIDLKNNEPASMPGEWTVKFLFNGEEIDSTKFTIENNSSP